MPSLLGSETGEQGPPVRGNGTADLTSSIERHGLTLLSA